MVVVAQKKLDWTDSVRTSEGDNLYVRRVVQGEMVTQSFEGLRRSLESIDPALGHIVAREPEREQTDVGPHITNDCIRSDQWMAVPVQCREYAEVGHFPEAEHRVIVDTGPVTKTNAPQRAERDAIHLSLVVVRPQKTAHQTGVPSRITQFAEKRRTQEHLAWLDFSVSRGSTGANCFS